jgi:hypothetical protein
VHLRDSKGLRYLDHLLRHEGQEVHSAQLVALDERSGGNLELGDAGEVLDEEARRAYRRRLEDLKEQLDEAERFDDTLRAERARAEMEALAGQLSGALGLGGRSRKAASTSERARVNVQRRLKDALSRIAAASPRAGRFLDASVRTGTYCAFEPVPR